MSFQSWLGSVNLHLIRHRNKTGRGRRPRYCGSERAVVAIESLEDRSLLSSTPLAADPVFLATGGFTFAATEGTLSASQTVATFTGPGGAEAVASYTATIHWGDGRPSSPGTISFSGDVFMVSGSHLYAEDGSYSVVTMISDTRTSGIPRRSTLNFDTVDASAGPVNASSYLASFGITLSAVTAGTAIGVVNNQSLYGGTAASPSSSPNVLTQLGSKNPVTYTLNFATPVDSFGFTRPMLLAGPSRIIHPRWSAHAFNAAGHEVALASESLLASAPSIPARTFSLTGNGITSVRFDSNAFNLAAISAVLIDDLTLTTTAAISVSATSLAQVSVANHSPTAIDDEVTTDESQVITFDVLTNDTDAEQNLAAGLTTNLTLPAKGVLTDLGNGSFSFEPNGEFESLGAGQSENVGFTYRIIDLLGETDTAVVTIEINGTNNAPSVSVAANSIGVDEGQAAMNLGAYADVDFGDVVNLSPSVGLVTENPDGTWSWSFNSNDGPDETQTVTITATDSHGADATTTFTLTVNNVAPTANDDSAIVNENDAAIIMDVLSNDTDPVGENDPLSASSVNSSGAQGTVTLSSGQVSYSADGFFEALGAGETDMDSFQYTISDGDGGSSTATVNVTVTGRNDAPVANGTLADVTVNQNAANSVVNLGGKFSDVDASDSLTLTAVSSSNGLVMASVLQASLMLDYQANQSGSARITVTATDGSGMSVNITFTVQVLSPQRQSQTIVNQITQWQTDGRINQGTVCSMISKIDNSLKSYNKGNIKAAENKLNALKNEIKAKTKPGSLTQADATLAIRLIDALIASLRP